MYLNWTITIRIFLVLFVSTEFNAGTRDAGTLINETAKKRKKLVNRIMFGIVFAITFSLYYFFPPTAGLQIPTNTILVFRTNAALGSRGSCTARCVFVLELTSTAKFSSICFPVLDLPYWFRHSIIVVIVRAIQNGFVPKQGGHLVALIKVNIARIFCSSFLFQIKFVQIFCSCRKIREQEFL